MGIGHELADNFLSQLDRLRLEKGGDIQIGDIDGLYKHIRGEDRDRLYEGVQAMADIIENARVELHNIDPDQISSDALSANLELDAVTKATEEAANRIMDAAEAIQNHVSSMEDETATKVSGEVVKLFEACDFQDITGQRISKVISTLKEIDNCINGLMDAISGTVELDVKMDKKDDNKDPDADLMNGPQLEAPSQDDIDKLFAGS